jgi:hypothetical protein
MAAPPSQGAPQLVQALMVRLAKAVAEVDYSPMAEMEGMAGAEEFRLPVPEEMVGSEVGRVLAEQDRARQDLAGAVLIRL